MSESNRDTCEPGTQPISVAEPPTTRSLKLIDLTTPPVIFLAGAAVAVAAMLFFSRSTPTKTLATAVHAPATPRQIQIVTLFDCQYITISEPFFLLHLPTCTNTHHYKQ